MPFFLPDCNLVQMALSLPSCLTFIRLNPSTDFCYPTTPLSPDTMGFAWFHPSWLSKGLASIAFGFVLYRLAWGILGGVPFDAVTPYGFTIDTWMSVANHVPVVIGIVGAVAIALLLRQRHMTSTTKAIVTVSSGFGTFFITGYILLWTLLSSGFAD